MINTVIIKDDGQGIKSDVHFDYSIVITDLGGPSDLPLPGVKPFDKPPTVELRAVREPVQRA